MPKLSISRRGFLWSTLGGLGAAAQPRREYGKPQFGIVGWGDRGRRYLDAVRAARIGVEALCELDEGRLRRGVEALGRAQRRAVPGNLDYRRLLDSLRTPDVIVSAPFPHAATIASEALARGKTVLLDSRTLFAAESAERLAETVGRGAAVYASGLDPRWPSCATRDLIGYAFARGADRVVTHFWHAAWSPEQLRAGAFEIIEAMRRANPSVPPPRPAFYAMRQAETRGGSIRLTASGSGFELRASMEISPGGAPLSAWELIDDFEVFTRCSPSDKAENWRQQHLSILAARRDPVSES